MKIETRSNLFTSLATRLTTFPGAVSPNAVLLRRNAYRVGRENSINVSMSDFNVAFPLTPTEYSIREKAISRKLEIDETTINPDPEYSKLAVIVYRVPLRYVTRSKD